MFGVEGNDNRASSNTDVCMEELKNKERFRGRTMVLIGYC